MGCVRSRSPGFAPWRPQKRISRIRTTPPLTLAEVITVSNGGTLGGTTSIIGLGVGSVAVTSRRPPRLRDGAARRVQDADLLDVVHAYHIGSACDSKRD